jgi:hypothetical protein
MTVGEVVAGAFIWVMCIVVALQIGGFRFGSAEMLCNCGYCQVPPGGDPSSPPPGG